jgi:rhodanese-related sulfurtransferase
MTNIKKFTTQIFVLMVLAAASVLPAWSGDVTRMRASQAHELAMRGDLILIDVRTPAEWEDTGIGASARAVSMHLPGFFDKVEKIVKGDKSKAIALICARGQRSNRMQTMLIERGYTNIIDVAEGMLGSPAGPGWLELGLPLRYPG